jgi:UDP-N-acetylglucosamine--N-acetylmuramyl-(pentapeptide) pyrophosphoryl-undecaprenol N-acetylglucosamine transferase
LTGGGSAGHVIPHIALLPLLQSQGYKIQYIGSKNGIEKEIIEKAAIPYHAIHSGKLRRYFSLKNFADPFRILAGYFESVKILRKIKPDCVFSKGGFVSVPVVFAAKHLKIPVVLHESDYTPGLANRLCIPKAQRICVSFQDTLAHIPEGKGVYTGTPVRQNLLCGNRQRGLELLGFEGKKSVLLIMGGSLGAKAVNEAVDESLNRLLQNFDVAHIRGQGAVREDLQGIAGYRQFEFISENIEHVFAAADIMISRAGANAVFEILALKIPSLLIPLSRSASRGDQILNARYFEKKGYAKVLFQEDMTPDSLYAAVLELFSEKKKYMQSMQKEDAKNSAHLIVQEILHAAGYQA